MSAKKTPPMLRVRCTQPQMVICLPTSSWLTVPHQSVRLGQVSWSMGALTEGSASVMPVEWHLI